MISPIATTSSAIFPSLLRVRSSAGRYYYPVKPLDSVAGVFKHIYTVPSKEGGGSLSLYKLRVLDSVIDRLVKYGKSSDIKEIVPSRITSENLDDTINKLTAALRNIRGKSSPYYRSLEPDVGKIINLFA